jgi:reactive intermediate/imine deaminase
MGRTETRTELAPAPAGPYSQAISIGSIVAVAGQLGIDPGTGHVLDGVAEQTRQALRNLGRILDASGASLDDVLRVGVFLAAAEDFDDMNKAYLEAFSVPYPARTTVTVGLPAGFKVEIDAIAVSPA